MFAIDATYARRAGRRPDGEVWASQTELRVSTAGTASTPKTHFVLAVGNKDSSGRGYTLQRADLQLDPAAPYLVRRWSREPAHGCTSQGHHCHFTLPLTGTL